jgi:flavorubredoxin
VNRLSQDKIARENIAMKTRIDEIADGIFRLSTHMAAIAPPAGFTFNQFLIRDEQPLLWHCGLKSLFPLVSEAVGRIMPIDRLRWISFGHVEADECGAMNAWLKAAPHAEAAHGVIGCEVSLNDLAIRPPRPLADGEVLDLGAKRVRHLDTPHVPHGWDAGLLFEESTATLLCGDLFTHVGDGPALTETDILGPAVEAEDLFHASALTPSSGATVRRLVELRPRRLALMHGSSFEGNCVAMLEGLAKDFDRRLREATVQEQDPKALP